MALPQSQTTPKAEPTIELTINTKPTDPAFNEPNTEEKVAKPAPPKLDHRDSVESVPAVDEYVSHRSRHSRPVRRPVPRRYSPSPVRMYNHPPIQEATPLIISSARLLDYVDFDGIVDMPYPSRTSIYLATFPFTDRDVKKWTWLLAHGIEEMWLSERDVKAIGDGGSEDEDEYLLGRPRGVRVCRDRHRDRSPYYNDFNVTSITSIFLSRALNTDVVPEDAENVRYYIVVRGRNRPEGATKLLTAESRKAAGILMYYEALTGNSIAFVGAVVGGVGKKAKKFKKAGDVETSGLGEDGVVGIIC